MELKPPVKTTITGEGTVVLHDVTRKGLHRLKVERNGEYPDLDVWRKLLPKEHRYLGCMTDEQLNPTGYVGILWIYYKMNGADDASKKS